MSVNPNGDQSLLKSELKEVNTLMKKNHHYSNLSPTNHNTSHKQSIRHQMDKKNPCEIDLGEQYHERVKSINNTQVSSQQSEKDNQTLEKDEGNTDITVEFKDEQPIQEKGSVKGSKATSSTKQTH